MRTKLLSPAAFPHRTATAAVSASRSDVRHAGRDPGEEGETAAANARWIAWLHTGGVLVDLQEEPPPV